MAYTPTVWNTGDLITADLLNKLEAGVQNEQVGPQGPQGEQGIQGETGTSGKEGVTFIPSVSEEGIISWTNDGGKENPDPANIKGNKGDDGFSPEITESTDNDETTYKLDITTSTGSFTTPNLKGVDGQGGGSVIVISQNAGAHNGYYRGKYLGDHVTEEQYAAIAAGTFGDLYIGDYWTIGGVNYRIAAFDYYLHCGDIETTLHHVTIVPDSTLYDTKMNSTNTTQGGYIGSAMYKTGLSQAKNIIKSAFSGHVLKHRNYLVNAVTSGFQSAGAWVDSEVELMNEQMVYGGAIFMPMNNGTRICASYRIEKSQLPLFSLDPSRITYRQKGWWLQDVVSSNNFASVREYGNALSTEASENRGVRPAFSIS